MRKSLAVLPALPLLLLGACNPTPPPEPQPPPAPAVAELIVRNANVFTGTGESAQAFAIANGRFLAVGSEVDVMAFKGEATQVVDAQGKRVTYPYVNPHLHTPAPPAAPLPCLGSDFAASPATMAGPSLAEVRECVSASIAAFPAGAPLLGIIGSQAMAELNATLDANTTALDDLSPNQSVLLVGWTGHTLYANTEAMFAAGLPPAAPLKNPESCVFERNPDGRLTGRFEEYCQLKFQRGFAKNAPAGYFEGLYKAVDTEGAKLGWVGFDTIAVDLHFQDERAVMERAGLKLDWRQVCFPQGPSDNCDGAQAVKVILDGTPVDELAHQHAPYEGGFHAAPWYGRDNFSQEALEGFARRSKEKGQQLLVHAVGDAAVDSLLNAVESVGGAPGWRLEHGYLATSAAYEKVKALEGTVVTEPVHTSLRPLYPYYYGAEVAERSQPVGSLLSRGVKVAFATDTFGTAGDPRVQMLLARFPVFISPQETVSGEQAFLLLSREAERARGYSDRGTIAPGQRGSFIVHGTDILRADLTPPELQSATIHLTVKDGQAVWDDGNLTPEGGWRQ